MNKEEKKNENTDLSNLCKEIALLFACFPGPPPTHRPQHPK